MSYRLASDNQQLIQSNGLRGGALFRKAPTRAAAGVRHALPEDSDIAVCGATLRYTWPQQWPGGMPHPAELCPRCVEVAGGL